MAAALDDRIQRDSRGAKSLKDALRHLVAWTARERRAFAIGELAGLVREATGVDVGAVIDEWLRPLE
jgi:predicted metalloprotease with PDZ domain